MKNKGITLIALVVTIVVLLILAAVSITVVFGEGGIIALAQEAAEKTKEAEEKTLTDLNDVVNKIGEITGTGGGEGNPPTNPSTDEEKFSSIYEETTEVETGDKQRIKVPKGFAAGISDNVNKVSEGFVITDAVDEDGHSTGNEFVWVPVPNIEDFHLIDGYNKDGEREDWMGYPMYAGDASKGESGVAMISSVGSNAGFYIGRYEAGKDDDGNLVVREK